MKKLFRGAACAALCAALLIGAQPAPASAAAGFDDVPDDAWYVEYLETMTQYAPGLISGYPDGTFRPDAPVTRGEFLKLVITAIEDMGLRFGSEASSAHWAARYWQRAYDNDVLLLNYNDQVVSGGDSLIFGSENDSLDKPISRYEMAVVISNATTAARDPRVEVVGSPSASIPDYGSIPANYADAVEQAYGKGILTGYGGSATVKPGSFLGDNTVTRAQAAKVAYYLVSGEREYADFVKPGELMQVSAPTNFESFAMRYRSMSDAERRTALFGDPNKTYFASSQEAAPYMTDVTVPCWKLDSSLNRYTSTITLTVHKLVADEVKLIFEEIYNDPERFPIVSWGGARFTDSLRHSWGCAIDLNADQNYYCRITNGSAAAITGSGWWPDSNVYSISPNGSVVRAFARYGWGWGGQGYSGGYHDYMHFSILQSGG